MKSLYELLIISLEKRLHLDARYFLSGGFWIGLTQTFVTIAGFITTVLFVNILSPEAYGTYKYLLGLAFIFASFSLTGLGQAIFQATAKKHLNFYFETFKVNAIYNFGVVISACAGAAYYLFNNNLTLGFGCLIIATIQPFINQFQFTPSILIGAKRFKEATFIQIFRTFFVTSTSLIAIYLSENILILFTSYLLSQSFSNFLSNLFFRSKNVESTPPAIYKEYISYAKDTTIRTFLINLSNKLDSVVLFTQVGPAELAVYAVAVLIPEQIRGLIKNLSSLLIPKYSEVNNSSQILNSLPRRSFQAFVILMIATIGYIIVSPIVYSFLFPKFAETVHYSQIFSLILLTNVVYLPHSLLLSKMSSKELYVLNVGGAIFQSCLFIILIPLMGIMGAIYTKLLYRFIFTIFTYIACYKAN